MLELKPFIYQFRTLGRHYIFDVNTNRIINVSREVYNYLDGKADEIQPSSQAEINKMVNAGFLSDKRIKEILHPASNNLEYILDSALEKITLQVTQQCNLRCGYCIYSGDHYKNRTHQSKKMSFDMAKRGIDHLIAHSQDSNKLNIGFYGGEPLLEFELIKSCVAYAKEKAEGKEVSFSITTNATLLTEEIIDYLSENNIMLTISLDGPREIHNRHRRFAGNGAGSFDKIIKDMENLRKKYPGYFEKIFFNIVLDPTSDFKCVSEFFLNYDAVKDSNQLANLPSTQYSKASIEVNENFSEEYGYEFFKVFLYKLGRLEKKYVSNLNLSYFERLKSHYHDKRTPSSGFFDYGHPGGPCIPGQMRLFMDVDGVFYPCERISEASNVMKIGSLDEGFDIGKCLQILNIGKITEQSCKNCWAFRYCTQCAAFADDTKSLTPEKRLMHCEDVRRDVGDYFRNYCTLLELGYDFDGEDPVLMQISKEQGGIWEYGT